MNDEFTVVLYGCQTANPFDKTMPLPSSPEWYAPGLLERIVALEARLARAEERIAALESAR